MNFKEVYERFLLIADLDKEQGSKWSVLCNEAIEQIASVLKPGADTQSNSRRLSAACASLAVYKMAMMQDAVQQAVSFKAGDVSVQTGATQKQSRQVWLFAKAQISDLIQDEDFFFEQVTV